MKIEIERKGRHIKATFKGYKVTISNKELTLEELIRGAERVKAAAKKKR